MALTVKNLPASAGDVRDIGSIPGSGRSPGEGNSNPLQYSCLENSMDQGAQWATVHGVAKCWTWLKQLGTHVHLMRFSLQSQIFKTPSWPQPNILNRALYSASHDFPDGPAVKTLQVFPGGPVIKTALPVQGSWVWSLFGELRSHMLYGMAKKIILSHVLTFSQTNCGVAFSLILLTLLSSSLVNQWSYSVVSDSLRSHGL